MEFNGGGRPSASDGPEAGLHMVNLSREALEETASLSASDSRTEGNPQVSNGGADLKCGRKCGM